MREPERPCSTSAGLCEDLLSNLPVGVYRVEATGHDYRFV